MPCCSTICPCNGCITFVDSNPKRLVDRINKYQAMGYAVDAMWYNFRCLFWVRYYVRLKLVCECKSNPKIIFSVGPVSNV